MMRASPDGGVAYAACWLFSLILLFRLWNEIWSNTIVMAQFFGPRESTAYIGGSSK